MIKDLRKQHGGGEIILDGKCAQRDGKWIVKREISKENVRG